MLCLNRVMCLNGGVLCSGCTSLAYRLQLRKSESDRPPAGHVALAFYRVIKVLPAVLRSKQQHQSIQ